MSAVDYALDGEVALLTVNYPPVNALSLATRIGLADALGKAEADSAVKAIVIPRKGCSPTPEDIIAYCRGRLAGYKIPKSVDFVAEFPMTATGKISGRYNASQPKRSVATRPWAKTIR